MGAKCAPTRAEVKTTILKSLHPDEWANLTERIDLVDRTTMHGSSESHTAYIYNHKPPRRPNPCDKLFAHGVEALRGDLGDLENLLKRKFAQSIEGGDRADRLGEPEEAALAASEGGRSMSDLEPPTWVEHLQLGIAGARP